ncbi:MAG: hypothetical protein QNK11_06595 [Legionella sp.]|nr:hypothetical protein [Legionella sp.]
MPRQKTLIEVYKQQGHAYTPFFESNKNEPGFFTPYQDVKDCKKQLQSVVFMFASCVTSTVLAAMSVLLCLTTAALDLVTFDFESSANHFITAVEQAYSAIVFSIHAIIDPLWQITAFITRSISTAGTLAKDAVVAASEVCCSPTTPGSDGT